MSDITLTAICSGLFAVPVKTDDVFLLERIEKLEEEIKRLWELIAAINKRLDEL